MSHDQGCCVVAPCSKSGEPKPWPPAARAQASQAHMNPIHTRVNSQTLATCCRCSSLSGTEEPHPPKPIPSAAPASRTSHLGDMRDTRPSPDQDVEGHELIVEAGELQGAHELIVQEGGVGAPHPPSTKEEGGHPKKGTHTALWVCEELLPV